MRSNLYLERHQQRIDEQRFGLPLGELISGHKKDLVLSNRLRQLPDRVAIYGWHRAPGDPIQPLSTVHGARYVDYSHGVRLVSADRRRGRPTALDLRRAPGLAGRTRLEPRGRDPGSLGLDAPARPGRSPRVAGAEQSTKGPRRDGRSRRFSGTRRYDGSTLVSVNGQMLNRRPAFRSHTMTAFDWGYKGNGGPAQSFTRRVIRGLPFGTWSLSGAQIDALCPQVEATDVLLDRFFLAACVSDDVGFSREAAP